MPSRRSLVIGVGLTAAAALIYSVLKAASKRLMDDCIQVLDWLAWRHERLSAYEPPSSPLEAQQRRQQQAPSDVKVDALVVHGCSMVAVPLGAADLFVDVLHPAGCHDVVLTGGVGRETPPLWDELAKRNMTALFGWCTAPWQCGSPPDSVTLPSQGGLRKDVLKTVDLEMDAAALRCFCTEADIFLELFVARCRERGLPVSFGGNPNADGCGTKLAGPRVFLETASTHTGTNVEFSRLTLAKLGLGGVAPTVAVVQQPALQRRTCLTWEKQTGVQPVGWTVRPTESSLGRSAAELLNYALGEMRRIPAYAAADKAFCVMPHDFPHHLMPSLIAYEPALTAALEIEKKAKAAGRR